MQTIMVIIVLGVFAGGFFLFCYMLYTVILYYFWPDKLLLTKRKQYLEQKIEQIYQYEKEAGKLFYCDENLKRLLSKRKYQEENIPKLLEQILNHIGLDMEEVELCILNNHTSRFTGQSYIAGAFYKDEFEKYKIVIDLKKEYHFQEIASILAHECTHFYMEKYKIPLKYEADNEKITDVLTVFLGFGAIMKKGYFERQRNFQVDMYRYKIVYSKIGYITNGDIVYIQKIIEKWEKEGNNLEEKKKNIMKIISSAENLYQSIFSNLDIYAEQSQKLETWEVIRELYIEKNKEEIKNNLLKIKKYDMMQLDKQNMNTIEVSVKKIYEQLNKWSLIIEKEKIKF